MNTETKQLFDVFKFKNGVETKNRIAMAPMTTWASNEDYTVADDEIRHYEARSKDVGLVITGCTRVMANGIGFTNEYASYDDSFLPGLEKLAAAAKMGGAPAILQIYHAGNKAVLDLIPDGVPVSASEVALAPSAFYPGGTVSRELTDEEVMEMIVKQRTGQSKQVLTVSNCTVPTDFYCRISFHLITIKEPIIGVDLLINV